MQTGMMWQGWNLEELLVERFRAQTGFQSGQRELTERLLQGERVLAIQRIDWRQALCYQVTSVCLPHLTLVFSPLKALLRDQCQRSNDCYGIPSSLISADKSLEENRATFTQAMAGNIKILFLALEQLDSIGWQRYIPKLKISLLVVEHAHCISTWSHDFQLHYRRIVEVVDDLAPNIPVLMLTEAANKRVEADILQQFCAAHVIRSSLRRSNLCLHVVRMNGDWEKLCYLAVVLQRREDAGIIYAATQGSAMMIAFFLCSQGIKAIYEPTNRGILIPPDSEQEYRASQHSVLCMASDQDKGTDNADIHFVIHYQAPGSLIDYYRDINTSKHDDHKTWCILLYDPADMLHQERSIKQNRPQEKHYREVLTLLQAHSQGMHTNNLLLNTGLSRPRLHTILGDLLEQGLVTFSEDMRRYRLASTESSGKRGVLAYEEDHIQAIDFSIHEQIRRKKLDELVALQQYTHTVHCYMAYLSNYLGDETNGYDRCGSCSNCNSSQFPDVRPTQGIQTVVTQFLERDFLPCIERKETEEGNVHETGWALSYHDGGRIGEQVQASKYHDAGPFPLGLVLRATEIAQTHYPVQDIKAVVSIPPSESGPLVEQFARQIASRLGKEYFAGLVKTRPTYIQKRLNNQVQKANNVRGAFAVIEPEKLTQCKILLIDDIYDSGCTLYEGSKTLMEAGAQAVYPLTITRVLRTNDE